MGGPLIGDITEHMRQPMNDAQKLALKAALAEVFGWEVRPAERLQGSDSIPKSVHDAGAG